jgi:hypothetical protein
MWELKNKLLSDSLSKKLSKYDNAIAWHLLKLNNYGYNKNSTRNITLKKNKEMSFLPQGKECVITDNGKWDAANRQIGKYGKIIRKVINEQSKSFEIVDKDLEELVNLLKASVSDGDFNIVSGDDIKYWYDVDVEGDTGSLSGSCMQGKPSRYFEIYSENSDVCSMVVLTRNEELVGRALLWNIGGEKYLDRIYGSDDTITKFKEYAKSNSWFFKAYQSYDEKTSWINPINGDQFEKLLTIRMNVDFVSYPYIDTFSYGDDNSLTNDIDTGWERKFSCTGGGYEDNEDRIWDDIDDCYIDDCDACFIEGRDIYTHHNNCVTNYDDVWILRDDAVMLHNGEWAHEDDSDLIYVEADDAYTIMEWCDSFYCEYNDKEYLEKNHDHEYLEELSITVHSDNVEAAYKDNGYVLVDGEWVDESTIEEDAE